MFHAIRQELSQGQRPFSGNWRPANDGKWKTPWRTNRAESLVEVDVGPRCFLVPIFAPPLPSFTFQIFQGFMRFEPERLEQQLKLLHGAFHHLVGVGRCPRQERLGKRTSGGRRRAEAAVPGAWVLQVGRGALLRWPPT